MSRLAILVTIALASPVALAAPKLKTDPPGLYFPAAVGDQWKVILVSPVVPEQENVQVVKAVETAGGVTTVTVENLRPDGEPGTTYLVEVSNQGVCITRSKGKQLDPPRWLLKLPAKPGFRWETPRFEPDRKDVRTEYRTIAGEEEVETPAGKFNAIRVDVRHRADGEVYQTEWHAVGWGHVRIQTGKSAIVLKSFTHGK
jgi:hypothetical protein